MDEIIKEVRDLAEHQRNLLIPPDDELAEDYQALVNAHNQEPN